VEKSKRSRAAGSFSRTGPPPRQPASLQTAGSGAQVDEVAQLVWKRSHAAWRNSAGVAGERASAATTAAGVVAHHRMPDGRDCTRIWWVRRVSAPAGGRPTRSAPGASEVQAARPPGTTAMRCQSRGSRPSGRSGERIGARCQQAPHTDARCGGPPVPPRAQWAHRAGHEDRADVSLSSRCTRPAHPPPSGEVAAAADGVHEGSCQWPGADAPPSAGLSTTRCPRPRTPPRAGSARARPPARAAAALPPRPVPRPAPGRPPSPGARRPGHDRRR
jgi:hypothetical protein